MNLFIQPYLNPLHIYCRLINMGIPKKTAGYMCRWYENHVYKCLIVPLKFKIIEFKRNKLTIRQEINYAY